MLDSEVDDLIRRSIEESASVITSVLNLIKDIKGAARLILDGFASGGKVLIFGNGGSAADSQHFAAELVGKLRVKRVALPAIALTVDTSAITAISNDWEFDYVFERQIEALGRKNDVAFGISTSGRSPNVIRALKRAKEMGLSTVALVGKYVDDVKPFSDIVISVSCTDTQRIQEAHALIIHILCEIIEMKISQAIKS